MCGCQPVILRLLRGMIVLESRRYVQPFQHLLAQSVVRQHAFHRPFNDLLRPLLHHRTERFGLQVPDVPGVLPVDFPPEFDRMELQLRRVDDDHLIAVHLVGGKRRAVLPPQQSRAFRRETAEVLPLRIDEEPPGSRRFHDGRFHFVGVLERLGASRFCGPASNPIISISTTFAPSPIRAPTGVMRVRPDGRSLYRTTNTSITFLLAFRSVTTRLSSRTASTGGCFFAYVSRRSTADRTTCALFFVVRTRS